MYSGFISSTPYVLSLHLRQVPASNVLIYLVEGIADRDRFI